MAEAAQRGVLAAQAALNRRDREGAMQGEQAEEQDTNEHDAERDLEADVAGAPENRRRAAPEPGPRAAVAPPPDEHPAPRPRARWIRRPPVPTKAQIEMHVLSQHVEYAPCTSAA